MHVQEVSKNLQRLATKTICTLEKIKPIPYSVWEIHAVTPKSLGVLLVRPQDSHEKTVQMKIISSLLSSGPPQRSLVQLLKEKCEVILS